MNTPPPSKKTPAAAPAAEARPWRLELSLENTASEVVRAAVADAWKTETGGELPPGLTEARAAEAQDVATLLARQHAKRHGGGPVVVEVTPAPDGRVGVQLHDEKRSAISAMVLPDAPPPASAPAPGIRAPRGSSTEAAAPTGSAGAKAPGKLQPADAATRKLSPPSTASEPRKLKPAPGTQRS